MPIQQSSISIITCINFASPMVGNLDFETAFRSLEADGKLRCLRVSNQFDIFTQLPDRGNWLSVIFCGCWGLHYWVWYVGWSLLFFLCFNSHVYRHVGMDLHMAKQWRYCRVPCWPPQEQSKPLLLRRMRWWCWRPWQQPSSSSSRHTTTNENQTRNNHLLTNTTNTANTAKAKQKLYSYKIKHSRGTPQRFAWRVAQDWRKHFKQGLQRLMMLPFVVDFNTNHSAQEHLERLSALAGELQGVSLKDLYMDRFPATDDDNDATATAAASPPTSPCSYSSPLIDAVTSGSCFA